jgi:hypothetical protein
MGEPRMIYLACASDYEYHAVLGAFSTREAAERYIAGLQREGTTTFQIEERELDPPRTRLPGAWLVRVDASGAELRDSSYYSHSEMPNGPAEPLTGGWGGGAQAWGLTRAAARRRARAILPARSSRSPHGASPEPTEADR